MKVERFVESWSRKSFILLSLDQYTIHILTFITDNLLNFLVSLLTFNPSGGSSLYNSLCRGLVYMENWVLELQKPLNWCKDGVKISRFLDPQEVELEMERFRLMTCEGCKYSYKKQPYLKQHPLNLEILKQGNLENPKKKSFSLETQRLRNKKKLVTLETYNLKNRNWENLSSYKFGSLDNLETLET